MDIQIGQAIKDYHIVEELGAGGFGRVFRARQASLEREVAIKIILPKYANDPDFILRFVGEAKLVASLEHPHIVPLYDFWRDPQGAFLVMRFVRGGNLAQRLQQGVLAIETAMPMLEQLVGALETAHRDGVVHRDLKPDNVLLDAQNNLYLTDFGIAKRTQDVSQSDGITGTLKYLAPEGLTSEPITPKFDLYGLGLMTYELLTGVYPFGDLSTSQLIMKHLHEPIPNICDSTDLPPAVNNVLQQATAKKAEDRFASVNEFLFALKQAISPQTAPEIAPLAPIENPYKGLRAFDESEYDDFFGRDALIEHLSDRLTQTRFLAVVGASGSGKSSVVRAGLMPRLRSEAFVVGFLPNDHPITSLAYALASISTQATAEKLDEQLRANVKSLDWLASQWLGKRDLVLVIDQLEEVFTLCTDAQEQAHFLALLHHAVSTPDSRVRVIVTLRADFMDKPLQYADFGKLLQQNVEFVLPMTASETEQAITLPALRVGLRVDSTLLAQLLSDVRAQVGALPLLQYALFEVCERRDGRDLTLGAYHAMGGMTGALAQRAEETFARLNPSQQTAMRQVFLRLITLGEGTEDTRRRAKLAELIAIAPHSGVADLLAPFTMQRLLTLDTDLLTREPTVEVAHEALIRTWERLKEWLNTSRDDIRQQRQLALATAEWEQANQDPSYLLSGNRLAQFAEWTTTTDVALTAQERAFVQASLNEQTAKRQQDEVRKAHEARLEKRSQAFLRGLVAVFALAMLGGFGLSAVAINGRNAAQNNLNVSESLRLASEAQNVLSQSRGDAELATLLGIRGLKTAYSKQADATLVKATDNLFIKKRFTGHTSDVSAVAFAPDGRTALSASQDNTLILWDVASGERIRTLTRHTGGVLGVAFAPDGKTALSASRDNTLILWDITNGEAIHTFTGHTSLVNSVAFAPDGKTALSASYDGTPILWDVASGDKIRTFTGYTSLVNSIAFAPDGKTALSASYDGTPILWDVASGDKIRTFTGYTSLVNSIAFAPDGKTALSASYDSTLILWDVATGKAIRIFAGHTNWVVGVSFSPDGKTALSASQDNTLILWDVASGKAIRTFVGHTSDVNKVAFAPDGKTALSGSLDSTLILWDVATGETLRTFTGHSDYVLGLAFAPDGKTALSGSYSTLILWDVSSGESIRTFTGHTNWVYAVAFAPDGKTALSASYDSTLILWDVTSGEAIRTFTGHTGGVLDVAVAPDGKTALSASRDNTLILWDVATGETLRTFTGHTGVVNSVTFAVDGKTALSGSSDNTLALWDVATGETLRTFIGHTKAVNSVAFSSDGKTALSGSSDTTLILWDVKTGENLRTFTEHTNWVYDVAFSPVGKTALSASRDNTLILWDVATGANLRTFTGHTGQISGIAFSPDSKTVLSASADETLRLWDVDYRDFITYACTRVFRDFTPEERERYGIRDNEPTCPQFGG
jgi:WD40 repeat protein/serine/threonine protein kinase